jgi:tripartite-type tricarboxylate transporter receptor subunit TctC
MDCRVKPGNDDWKRWVVAIAVLGAVCAVPARAGPVEDFYRGKTVELLIGAAAGGGYDLPGRVIARHMGRHIPGEPGMIVRNMPGATSVPMTNFLYNRAARDGTIIGMPNNSIPLEPQLKMLSSAGAVAFDIGRFSWLGTPVQEPNVFWVWHTAPAKSFADLKTQKIIMGATATTADNYILSYLMNQVFGTRMTFVTGYRGQSDINLAAERGEVQGNTTGLTNVLVNKGDWYREGKMRLLVQFGTERVPEIKDVPAVVEFATTDDDRAIWQFFTLKFRMARPLALPPEVPAERVKALQDAFDATMKDPQFLDEAKQIGLEINPLNGEQIGALIRQMQATPQAVVDRLRGLLVTAK